MLQHLLLVRVRTLAGTLRWNACRPSLQCSMGRPVATFLLTRVVSGTLCGKARVEQGDPSMPGLYALGQHAALLSIHGQRRPTERLYAFLDDVCSTSQPERTVPALRVAQDALSTRLPYSPPHKPQRTLLGGAGLGCLPRLPATTTRPRPSGACSVGGGLLIARLMCDPRPERRCSPKLDRAR